MTHGKAWFFVGVPFVLEDQLPDDVVEGGAKVVEGVRVDQRKGLERRIGVDVPTKPVPAIGLLLVGDEIRVGFAIKELGKGAAKSIQVFACPVELRVDPDKIGHRLGA